MYQPANLATRSILAVALGASCVTGCATTRIPLTQELREQHRLSPDELKNLQYYVSNTITLRRELDSTGKQITGGHKLVLTSGKSIEEVVVEEGTPGVALEVGRTHLIVSFGAGVDLRFALREDGTYVSDALGGRAYARAPDPFPGNHPNSGRPAPQPEPTGLTGKFWLATDQNTNQVFLQGKWFDAVKDSLRAHLLIAAEALDDVDEQRTVVPGMRL